MKISNPTASNPTSLLTAEAAFFSMREQIEALPSTELVSINIDIAHAVSVALGAADRVEALGPDLTRLEGFDGEAVEHLRTYALAALHAHLVVVQCQDPGEAFSLLLHEATELRDGLRIAAEALAHHELLCGARVARIRRGRGAIRVAGELIALSALLREGWARIAQKTPITLDEIARAASLGAELHAAVGARDLGPDPRAELKDTRLLRDKAFTLFMRAYDECRRGVIYLRWHEGDADAYAPSIYRRRKRRGSSSPTGMIEVAERTESSVESNTGSVTVLPVRAEEVA